MDITDPESIKAMTPADMKHWQFMNTTATGKTLGIAGDIASGVSHSAVQVLKGAKQLTDLVPHMDEKGHLSTDTYNNILYDKLDKWADLGLSPNDIKNVERGTGGGIVQTAKMAAGVIPLAAGGEALGATKTLFALQGLGQAKEQLDNIEQSGVKVSPWAKATYSVLSAATNAYFMGDAGAGVVSKFPSAMRSRIVDGITAETMKETAGKALTDAELKNALTNNIQKWSLNLKNGGTSFLKNWAESTKDRSKFTLANWGAEKATNVVNEASGNQPVFQNTDLIGDLGKNVEQGALF